jgi:hypothetical protein
MQVFVVSTNCGVYVLDAIAVVAYNNNNKNMATEEEEKKATIEVFDRLWADAKRNGDNAYANIVCGAMKAAYVAGLWWFVDAVDDNVTFGQLDYRTFLDHQGRIRGAPDDPHGPTNVRIALQLLLAVGLKHAIAHPDDVFFDEHEYMDSFRKQMHLSFADCITGAFDDGEFLRAVLATIEPWEGGDDEDDDDEDDMLLLLAIVLL